MSALTGISAWARRNREIADTTSKPRRASLLTGEWRRLAWFGGTLAAGLLWIAYLVVIGDAPAVDAHAYYVAQLGHLYRDGQAGARDLYVYSPAFAQAVEPLRWLGASGFVAVWRALEVAALLALTGPWAIVLLFVQPFAPEVAAGNIHILLGLAIVAGFRWPATWSFVLLTKITPGIGLLWFAVRREWRNLGIAIGATAVIAAVSFGAAPADWFGWLGMLRSQTVMSDAFELVSAPLIARLAFAAGLVAWGARTDRRWTVLVAAFLALPVTWVNAGAMFAGLVVLGHGVPRIGDEDHATPISPSALRTSVVTVPAPPQRKSGASPAAPGTRGRCSRGGSCC